MQLDAFFVHDIVSTFQVEGDVFSHVDLVSTASSQSLADAERKVMLCPHDT
jgi:hypothetical protein